MNSSLMQPLSYGIYGAGETKRRKHRLRCRYGRLSGQTNNRFILLRSSGSFASATLPRLHRAFLVESIQPPLHCTLLEAVRTQISEYVFYLDSVAEVQQSVQKSKYNRIPIEIEIYN